MIDLHLHTTASDGLLSPGDLVARAAAAGITVLAVTDHDTIAGLAAAREAAVARGIELVPGIEITAVEGTRDVHVLGYFFDPSSASLAAFLESQRADRVRRFRAMAERLNALGATVDAEMLVTMHASRPGRSIGRPQLADALVAAGHALDREDAFHRFLAHGAPAYVPRSGVPPEEVIHLVARAGGITSIAHPGLLRDDVLVRRLARAGLTAIEVRHSDHDEATEHHYRQMAASLGVAVSGGSDFHGDTGHRAAMLGAVTLPRPDFTELERRSRGTLLQ